MYIDPKKTLFGQPGKQVRDFLRSTVYCSDDITSLDASRFFSIPINKANLFLNEMLAAGLCEENPREEISDNKRSVRIVDDIMYGRIRAASCSKPISRKVAEKNLNEFLERVKVANENTDYLYYVKRVDVFGSYVEDVDILSDIDIAFQLERKAKYCTDDYINFALKRAKDSGRNFRDYIDKLFWPEVEVEMFLKNKSRVLSLLPYSEYQSLQNTNGVNLYSFDEAV